MTDSVSTMMGLVMSGQLIFFSFYTGAYAMMSILLESEEGTLARLCTTPTNRTTILAGKFLAVFITVIVQGAVLLIAGHYLFKINWGEPGSLILSLLGQMFASVGLAVLLISFTKTSKQAGPVLGGGLTMLSMISGLFTANMGIEIFDSMGNFTPQGWVLKAWKLSIAGQPAYATQEILIILAMGGAAALSLVLPISIAIVVLLAIVTFSYEQTIHAYPGGGGAYIVARDNIGELAAQVAGAALLMDYILTVAVSISSGVAQITSAFPALFPVRVEIAVAFVAFVMIVNLRGVKESVAVFALPTYFFVAMMYLTVVSALFRHLAGTLGRVPDPPPLDIEPTAAIGLFLVLHAFSSGTTALTGVEAISNGIPAFTISMQRCGT